MADSFALNDRQFDKLVGKIDDIITTIGRVSNNSGNSNLGGGSNSASVKNEDKTTKPLNYDDFDTDAYEHSLEEEKAKKKPFSYYRNAKREYAVSKREYEDAKAASMADPNNKDKKEKLIEAKDKYDTSSNKLAEGKKGVAATVGAIEGALLKMADSISNIVLLNMKKDQAEFFADMQKKTAILEANSKIFNNSLQLTSSAVIKSIQSSFQSITSGVKEGAYAAATSMLSLSTDAMNKELERQQIEMHKRNVISIAEQTKQNEITKANTEQLKEISTMTKTAAGAIAVIPGVGWVASAMIVAGGALVECITAISAKMQQAESEMALERQKARIEYNEKQLEAINNTIRSLVEGAQQITDTCLSFANEISSITEKMDDAFTKAGRNLGMDADALISYKDRMFNESKSLYITKRDGSRTFMDKNGEDLSKLQSQYNENTGFAIELQHEDFMKTFSMGKLWGDDVMVDLVSQMQLFNHSAADSSDIFFEMYDNARKAGISQAKYAKQLQKDLKLANKYQFKNGTKGLMEMSIWAQKTRFNMDSLSGMLDDIHSGGLEGLITKAAGMQVLGGGFAMGADPLAMGWEAFNDPAAYAQRMQNMMKGIGRFNSKTGEVVFNMEDQMRLEQFAKLSGQSVEDLMNQRRQSVKGAMIENVLTKDYTDEQKALIYAKATRDQDGNWTVNGKDINNLQEDDFAELMPHEEQIEYYVGGIYSMMEQMTGVTNYGQATTVDNTRTSWYENMNAQMQENVRFFEKNADALKTIVTSGYEYMTTANVEMHNFMQSSAGIINTVFATVNKLSEDMRDYLTKSDGDFQKGLVAFNQGATAFKEYCEEVAGIDTNGMDGGDRELAEVLVRIMSNSNNVGKYDVKHLRDFLNDADEWAWHDITGKNHGFTNETEDKFFSKLPEKYKNMIREDSGSILKETLRGIKEGRYGDLHIPGFNDGITNGKGMPMTVAASKVTPINDGEVATTNPNDHGIFAKVGGPFDKLFNGIFARINSVYDVITNTDTSSMEWEAFEDPISLYSDALRLGLNYNQIQARPYDPFEGLSVRDNYGVNNSNNNSRQSPTMNNNSIRVEPITLNINLDGALGGSRTFMEELVNEPGMMRTITRLVSEAISSQFNGGRGVYNGGSLVSFNN